MGECVKLQVNIWIGAGCLVVENQGCGRLAPASWGSWEHKVQRPSTFREIKIKKNVPYSWWVWLFRLPNTQSIIASSQSFCGVGDKFSSSRWFSAVRNTTSVSFFLNPPHHLAASGSVLLPFARDSEQLIPEEAGAEGSTQPGCQLFQWEQPFLLCSKRKIHMSTCFTYQTTVITSFHSGIRMHGFKFYFHHLLTMAFVQQLSLNFHGGKTGACVSNLLLKTKWDDSKCSIAHSRLSGSVCSCLSNGFIVLGCECGCSFICLCHISPKPKYMVLLTWSSSQRLLCVPGWDINLNSASHLGKLLSFQITSFQNQRFATCLNPQSSIRLLSGTSEIPEELSISSSKQIAWGLSHS